MKNNILYFEEEGAINVSDVIGIVAKTTEILNINKVVIFSASISSPKLLKEILNDDNKKIIVVTFPFGSKFEVQSENDKDKLEKRMIIPEMLHHNARNELFNIGIEFVQGVMPFSPILSQTGDNSLEMIVSTLNIISKGLQLCVQASIMAYEAGYIDEKEDVIAMSGDTAVVVSPCMKRDFFDPDIGFKIKQILCKPY